MKTQYCFSKKTRFMHILSCLLISLLILLQSVQLKSYAIETDIESVDTGWSDTGKINISINPSKSHLTIFT